MCSLCMKSPCDSRCPNAPDPQAVTDCARCHNKIYPGEEYATIDGLDYCECCIEDMPSSELVTLFGGEWKKATEDDLDDGYDG